MRIKEFILCAALNQARLAALKRWFNKLKIQSMQVYTIDSFNNQTESFEP
jgi:hypothetical protein